MKSAGLVSTEGGVVPKGFSEVLAAGRVGWLNEGRLQRDTEGAIEATAGGGGELRKELAAVVVETEASANDELRADRVREAESGADAPLAAGEGGVRGAGGGVLLVIAGDDEAAVGDGVRGGVVAVARGIEVDEIAVLLVQASVVVVAQAERDGKVRRGLLLVLVEGADLWRAIVAVAGALEVDGVTRAVTERSAGEEIGEAGVLEGGDLVGAVEDVELGEVVVAAEGEAVAADDVVECGASFEGVLGEPVLEKLEVGPMLRLLRPLMSRTVTPGKSVLPKRLMPASSGVKGCPVSEATFMRM